MKLSAAEPTNFEELTFPVTVYKYREANNPIHRTILTEQKVYFAPVKYFEDEFDCKNPYRYDLLTDTELYQEYIIAFNEMYPEWDTLYLHQQAISWFNKDLLKDKKRMAELDLKEYENLNEVHGVLSLTMNCASIEMWKKYSDNFNGFCIGFDPKIIFKYLGSGGKVNYVDTLPIINPLDASDIKFTTLIFSKLKKWAFEEEYRTQRMWSLPADNEMRKTKLPSSAYTKLILGHNTNTDTQQEIIKQARVVNPMIEILITTITDYNISIKSYA